MTKRCQSCGGPFETRSSRARFCGSACRSRAWRSGVTLPPDGLVAVPAPAAAPAASAEPGELVSAAERQLREAGRLDTWQARAALDLAGRLERSAVDTGSSYASLHRELRNAMELALRGANAPKSALQARRDELAALRARKDRQR